MSEDQPEAEAAEAHDAVSEPDAILLSDEAPYELFLEPNRRNDRIWSNIGSGVDCPEGEAPAEGSCLGQGELQRPL